MSSIPGQEERTSLRKSLDLLHTSASLGLLIAEGKRILEANEAFLRMIRCTREELPNFDWQAATPPEYLELDFRAMEQLRTLGACMPFEKEYVLPDGSKVHFMIGAVRLQMDPLQWACYTVDLSEHRRAAEVEQLSRALRAKYDLINQLAHELNNPLAALTFQLHLLESHPGVVGDARKLVADANEQLARISAIVQVVLAAGSGTNK